MENQRKRVGPQMTDCLAGLIPLLGRSNRNYTHFKWGSINQADAVPAKYGKILRQPLPLINRIRRCWPRTQEDSKRKNTTACRDNPEFPFGAHIFFRAKIVNGLHLNPEFAPHFL